VENRDKGSDAPHEARGSSVFTLDQGKPPLAHYISLGGAAILRGKVTVIGTMLGEKSLRQKEVAKELESTSKLKLSSTRRTSPQGKEIGGPDRNIR